MKITNQQKIDVFIRSLQGDEDVFLHPKKPNSLMVDGKILQVDAGQYDLFWNTYDSASYSLEEVKNITGDLDTLINETERRYHGDFFTPKIWVDHAHGLIEKQLGENWREDYVVWDPAAGTKNLTRDYRFGELYSSTLHREELSTSTWYNQEGVAFQYDFLNDDMQIHDMSKEEVLAAARAGELKMPAGIVEALYENRPFVFFANPPYGSIHNNKNDGTTKKDISKTGLRSIMKPNMGHANRELYTQFMYRVQLLAELFDYTENFHVLFFTPAKFFPSPYFRKFLEVFTAQFTYRDGFMLNAGEFNGTSAVWGILFSHWDIGENINKDNLEFNFRVMQINKDDADFSIKKTCDWRGISREKGQTISDWVKSVQVSSEDDASVPMTKNGFDSPTSLVRGRVKKGWIGFAHNNGFNVQYSEKYIGMYSMGFGAGQGYTITRDNLDRSAITFSIRRSVFENIEKQKQAQLWSRWEDIFTAPPEELVTPEFTTDCMVYSLFDHKSRQTSLRDYEYNDRKYRVVNEFFPYSRDRINDLAVKHHNLVIQADLATDRERVVYQWLEDHREDLSTEAQDVLEYAWFLIEESFPLRDKYKRAYPTREARYQTNTWDAGWVQINRMIFGDDRIDDSMIQYKDEWKQKVRVLGDRIAAAAMDAGVI